MAQADTRQEQRRRYRKVYVRIWTNPVFQALDDPHRVLTLYLLTGPQTNRIGLYRLSFGEALEDLAWKSAAFQKRFKAVCAAFGWRYDPPTRTFWIPSWWTWNEPENPNVLKGALNDLAEVPTSALMVAFWRTTRATFPKVNLPETLPQTLPATLTPTLPQTLPESGTGTGTGSTTREIPPGLGERLWEHWRELMASRVSLPLQPQTEAERKGVLEACQRLPDERRLLGALDRFVRLSDDERRRLNVKALTLGYFVMALPDLVAAPTRPARCHHAEPCPDAATCTQRYLAEQTQVAS